MNAPRLCCLLLGIALWQANASPRLNLPRFVYAVPGIEMNVYFENTVLSVPGAPEYRFRCVCRVGEVSSKRWTLKAGRDDEGTHPFQLSVLDSAGKVLETAHATLVVSPPTAGEGGAINLLIIGDSLTHASGYPNEIARLLSGPGNPTWRMLGTHRPASAAEGVAHEGYGGWTWNRFRTKFTPERPVPGKTNSSPFVFADPDGVPRLDIGRYFRERCDGHRPDFITVLLGINDCFSAKPDSPETIDPRIDQMFRESEPLLKALRAAAPDATIGICVTPPGNSRDAAFAANYKDRYTRWGWRRIQHRLAERQLAEFDKREGDNIRAIPVQLNLDTTDGYPANNGVHPNEAGYAQIGASIYAWIKSCLADGDAR